jgi:hypothetical protein
VVLLTKTGVVKSIRKKQVNGSLLTKMDIGDDKVSFFPDMGVELGNIQEGDKVEYKTEQNGQHTNLTEIGLIEKGSGISSEGDEMKKGAALKAAARVSSSPEDAKDTAKEFYQLLKEGDWDEG